MSRREPRAWSSRLDGALSRKCCDRVPVTERPCPESCPRRGESHVHFECNRCGRLWWIYGPVRFTRRSSKGALAALALLMSLQSPELCRPIKLVPAAIAHRQHRRSGVVNEVVQPLATPQPKKDKP